MQPHRYTTYERDANGGDEAMFRRYESRWQRFAQPDPFDGSYDLTNPQSLNRYSYTQNDPVNFVDPSGLLPSVECPPGWDCINGGTAWAPRFWLGYLGADYGWRGGGDGFGDPLRERHRGEDPQKTPQQPSSEGFPCPPALDDILNGRVSPQSAKSIGAAVQKARELMMNAPPGEHREQGGWIYMNRRGGLTAVLQTLGPADAKNNATSIDQNSPPRLPGRIVVSYFHTHINEVGPSGDERDGTPGDRLNAAWYHKVPGFVVLPSGAMIGYGPARGFWRQQLPSRCQ